MPQLDPARSKLRRTSKSSIRVRRMRSATSMESPSAVCTRSVIPPTSGPSSARTWRAGELVGPGQNARRGNTTTKQRQGYTYPHTFGNVPSPSSGETGLRPRGYDRGDRVAASQAGQVRHGVAQRVREVLPAVHEGAPRHAERLEAQRELGGRGATARRRHLAKDPRHRCGEKPTSVDSLYLPKYLNASEYDR